MSEEKPTWWDELKEEFKASPFKDIRRYREKIKGGDKK